MLKAESSKLKGTSEKDREFYILELAGNECACGKTKGAKRSFCYPCYSALPGDMQRALYRAIQCGYPEAYEAAHTWLSENIW